MVSDEKIKHERQKTAREIFADIDKKLDKEGFLNGYELIELKKKWGVDE